VVQGLIPEELQKALEEVQMLHQEQRLSAIAHRKIVPEPAKKISSDAKIVKLHE
jgi:hypothetical protein